MKKGLLDNAVLTVMYTSVLTERQSSSLKASRGQGGRKDYLILSIYTSSLEFKMSQAARQRAVIQLQGQPAIDPSNPAGYSTRELSIKISQLGSLTADRQKIKLQLVSRHKIDW